MSRMSTLAGALMCMGFFSAMPAAAAPSDEDVAACLQMIRDMVGVEPSPTVTEYCEQGDPEGAMKAAMAGE